MPNPEIDVPTIFVEFVSESSRDRKRDYIEKREEYSEIGVAEYWVIDRFARTMTVFHSDGSETAVSETQTHTTELLPGFELGPCVLFAISDRHS